MKVLMFGWEFPPHIYGGLGTATFGLVNGLHSCSDVEITLLLPKAYGDEDNSNIRIISAESVCVPGRGYIKFSGGYGGNLFEEIYNLRTVTQTLINELDFDIIHCHDWLTYPAGVLAKSVSGKPLFVHVHATDYDRSRGKVNPVVYGIEREGMTAADCVVCVSGLTRNIVISNYGQKPDKVQVLYNAVEPMADADIYDKHRILTLEGFHTVYPRQEHIVTFMGRITMQKGPEYFVSVAAQVLRQRKDVRFVMAGGGDKMEEMIRYAARLGISHRFHFLGFLNSTGVKTLLGISSVYVMPSVSEPFGISPLEAMQLGCPVIVSRQSGCSEILSDVLKYDYWDILGMSDGINGILGNTGSTNNSTPCALYNVLSNRGRDEVSNITWQKSGSTLKKMYNRFVNL